MTNEIKQLLNIINEDEDVLKILTEKYTELQRDFDDKFHTLEKCKFKIMDWISINENNIRIEKIQASHLTLFFRNDR